jgi:hypothetical protein
LESIIDRLSQLLFASDIAFRRLHRRVTKEELNLFEFASSAMTETGATATKVVGGQVVNAHKLGASFHGIPNYIGGYSGILPSSILQNSSEDSPSSHS